MKIFKYLFLMALPVILLSCGDSSNTRQRNNNDMNKDKENKDNTNTKRDTVSTGSLLPFNIFNGEQDKTDEDFLKEAANGGLMEVELGKYAEEYAGNPRVKKFGAMMVRDHSKANEELKSLAISKNVELPAALDDSHKNMLFEMMQVKGEDFDKAYIKNMLDDHEKDVDKFQKQAEACNKVFHWVLFGTVPYISPSFG
jgi:putative membrane protein